MNVAPSQLIPGCLLLNDVKGKSNQPIIPKDTVLTEEHIKFLQAFLVKSVNVSKELATGETFVPKNNQKENGNSRKSIKQEDFPSFEEHYLAVIHEFKKHFTSWQNYMPLNMPEIRQFLVPLIKRVNELKEKIYRIQQHVTTDDYFYHHCITVGLLSAFLAKQIGYLEHEWTQVGLAGVLSDTGMAKLDKEMLYKDTPLTFQEMKKVKNHPTYSYRLIEKSPIITQTVKLAVLQHHERMDGSGYPLGLNGRKIHPYARIIAVCDTFHAMTNKRYYKDKKSPFLALDDLDKEQFSGLDPTVVHTFIKSIAYLSIGAKVRLSNQSIAEIVFIEDNHPTKPMVKLEDTGEIISLKNRTDLHILEIFLVGS